MRGKIARFLGLWVSALVGCGSPPAPGAPPEPPRPAADACPPVGSPFANARFFFMDDREPASCVVYLEQDECVLGIFEDCTVVEAARRQWEGRVVPEGPDLMLELQSVSVGSSNAVPALSCGGDLVLGDEPPRSQLRCDGPRLVLEREDKDRPPFGEVSSSLRLSPDAPWIEDMILFEGQAREQLWAVVNAGVSEGGGLFVQKRDLGGEWRRTDADFGGTTVNYPTLTSLAVMPSGDKVVVTGATALLRVDAATVVVDEIVELPEGFGYFGVAPLSANEFLALAVIEGTGVDLERWTVEPFVKVADEARIDDLGVSKFFTGTSTEPIVVGGRRGDAVEGFVFERDNLEEPASVQTLVYNYAGGVFMEGHRALAVLHQKGARIFELGKEEPGRWLPVPYFQIHTGVGYDPLGDTIFIAGEVHGRGPGIARFDRASAWASSDILETDSTASLMRTFRDGLYAAVGGYVHEIRLR